MAVLLSCVYSLSIFIMQRLRMQCKSFSERETLRHFATYLYEFVTKSEFLCCRYKIPDKTLLFQCTIVNYEVWNS